MLFAELAVVLIGDIVLSMAFDEAGLSLVAFQTVSTVIIGMLRIFSKRSDILFSIVCTLVVITLFCTGLVLVALRAVSITIFPLGNHSTQALFFHS